MAGPLRRRAGRAAPLPPEQAVEPAQGGAPAALDGAGGDAEGGGGLARAEAVVVAQPEHLALVLGQPVHQLVHAVEVEGVVGGGGGEGGGVRAAVVVGGGAARAVVVPPQVEELAADQDGRQVVEGP